MMLSLELAPDTAPYVCKKICRSISRSAVEGFLLNKTIESVVA